MSLEILNRYRNSSDDIKFPNGTVFIDGVINNCRGIQIDGGTTTAWADWHIRSAEIINDRLVITTDVACSRWIRNNCMHLSEDQLNAIILCQGVLWSV